MYTNNCEVVPIQIAGSSKMTHIPKISKNDRKKCVLPDRKFNIASKLSIFSIVATFTDARNWLIAWLKKW